MGQTDRCYKQGPDSQNWQARCEWSPQPFKWNYLQLSLGHLLEKKSIHPVCSHKIPDFTESPLPDPRTTHCGCETKHEDQHKKLNTTEVLLSSESTSPRAQEGKAGQTQEAHSGRSQKQTLPNQFWLVHYFVPYCFSPPPPACQRLTLPKGSEWGPTSYPRCRDQSKVCEGLSLQHSAGAALCPVIAVLPLFPFSLQLFLLLY